jgi:hypothetical protein
MQNPDSRLNPYESPKGVEEQFVTDEPWLKAYEPCVMPRDAVDVLLGSIFAAIVSAFVFSPLIVLFWLNAPEIYLWGWIGFIIVMATLAMLFGIRQVELSDDELIARRVLLPTLRWRWSMVTRVRQAGRWEAFLAAIVLPHRCCSYTFTSRDQICIEVGSEKVLFPAKEVEAFRTSTRLLAARNNPNFAA